MDKPKFYKKAKVTELEGGAKFFVLTGKAIDKELSDLYECFNYEQVEMVVKEETGKEPNALDSIFQGFTRNAIVSPEYVGNGRVCVVCKARYS